MVSTLNGRVPVILTIALAAFALGGCTAGEPVPEPTVTITPPVQEDPVAAAIVIDASGFVIEDSEGVPSQPILFASSPEEAIAAISDALGSDPEIVTEGEQTCFGEYTAARWGEGFTLTHGENLPLPADALFAVEATVAEVDGIRIEAPGGFAVGDQSLDLAASVPDAPLEELGTTGGVIVYYDVVTGTPDGGDEFYGAYSLDLEGAGAITNLEAPVDFRFDC